MDFLEVLSHPSMEGDTPEAPPRGIAPFRLLDQIRNTAPYLMDESIDIPRGEYPYLHELRHWDRRLRQIPSLQLTHEEYYSLCLSAHHATVATFVPTDVDNQIRWKLWHPSVSLSSIQRQVELVLESREWDHEWVSTRSTSYEGKSVSGHQGEWFSTAIGAYLATKRRLIRLATIVAGEVLDELEREAEIFIGLRKCKQGIEALKAATLIAHNVGDLNRVFEMWEIKEDPLLQRVQERLTQPPFPTIGQLNTQWMALENHRHFALRKPRSLRRFQDLLLPVGPFFDSWGEKVARHPGLSMEELGSIVEALVDGYERLPGTVGYARALRGIEESVSGGLENLLKYVPRRTAGTLRTGELRKLVSVNRHRFEACWEKRGVSP